MACSIEEHKKKVNDEMHKIFHQTKTIKIVNNIVTITPSEKSDKIKDIKTANAIADERIKEANDWGKAEYGKAFSGFAIKNKSKSDNDKVVINLHFPDKLEQALLYKEKQEKALLEYNNNLLINSSKDIFDVKFNQSDSNNTSTEGYNNAFVKSLPSETTAIELLNSILASDKGQLRMLARILLNYFKENNVKVMIDDVVDYPASETNTKDRGVAMYNPKTNTIHLAKRGNYRLSSKLTAMHEVLHSISYHKLEHDKTNRTVVDFRTLYTYATSKLNKDDYYGLTDPHEFLVALFTDERLVAKLKEIPPRKNIKEYNNLFEEFMNIILSLVGIKKSSSLYEQAYAIATNIIEEQRLSSEALRESIEGDNVSPLFSIEEKPKEKENKQKAYEQQYVFFKRRLNKLKKELDRVDKGSDEFKVKKSELDAMINRFNAATEIQDKEEYVEMAKEYLKWVENLVKRLNTNTVTKEELINAFEILEAFKNFDVELSGLIMKLESQLMPYIFKNNLRIVNKYNTSGKEITLEDIDNQTKDVRWSVKSFGSLLDVVNYIARTIGSVIKDAQNKASTKNKALEAVVQKEVDALNKYAKDNGMTLEEVYELFIQEKNGTLVLTQRYVNGKENPNYNTIQNTPELKKFYDFYQRVIEVSQMNLPYKVGKYYILNKAKSDIKRDITRILPTEDMLFENFVSNEELLADIVPDMFRKNIPADKKSRDLGSGLLEFAAYANNHNALSEALSEVRLLQKQLKYTQNPDGSLIERQYIKSSDPTSKVNAGDSNIYNMVKIVIDMQLKGKMTDEKTTPLKLKPIKDEEGNIIGYKQVRIESVMDLMLRWNSLLRIGLSPITSLTNALFGDISNVMEAIGGKHFTFSDLHNASKIFFKQVDYVSNAKESNVYQWLNKLNPLQELTDYDLGSGLTANSKKLSKEKAMELMYSMQKKGELYLQTRTMLAMLIHEGYMNPDGTNTKKGENITEEEATRLSDKIQKLNQTIHGRYSQREASTLSQSVWWRAAIQFRKWIPSAIEARFGDYKEWDNRLQTDTEGRYRTFARKVFKAENVAQAFENLFLPILNSKAALERGNMTPTEIYNMRKNMVELILITATLLLAVGIKGDDDEWKKNPYAKAGLTILNRISGDLLFFYNPSNISNIASNAAPVSKLIIDLIDVGKSIPHAMYLGDYQVKKGSLKGSNEFYMQDIPEIFPGFAPASQLQKIFNDIDVLQELN